MFILIKICFKTYKIIQIRYIAIDDVEIEIGACPAEATCDFENGYCGFYNTKEGDDFDWLRAKGKVFSFTGPQVDHTTNSEVGYYLYINAVTEMKIGLKYLTKSFKKNNLKFDILLGDSAWLVSEVFEAPQDACLSWYMHLYGKSIGNLTVYKRLTYKNPQQIWQTKVFI